MIAMIKACSYQKKKKLWPYAFICPWPFWDLQQKIRVRKVYCYHENFVFEVFSAIAWIYKIEMKVIPQWFTTNDYSVKAFWNQQNIIPKELLVSAFQKLIYVYKVMKKLRIKSDLKVILLRLTTKDKSVNGFLLLPKFHL